MEYSVGCLADLISGVKSPSSKSSKIVLQPVSIARNITGKKRKSASAEFTPVIGPAESAVVPPKASKTEFKNSEKLKSTKKKNGHRDALRTTPSEFAGNSNNAMSTKKKNRHRDALGTTPSKFVGNSNNAMSTKKKNRHRDALRTTPSEFVGNSNNAMSTKKKNRHRDALGTTPSKFVGNSNNAMSTKKKNRHRDALRTTPSEFAGNSNNAMVSSIDIPKHPLDEAAEARTVFVKNLPINMKIKKTKKIFERFGEVECVRYRCTPRADTRIPKKVAFITKTFHPDRTTICAFVRFKSEDGAHKALSEAKGMELDGHHILVDKSLKDNVHDQKRAVFVGNVPFAAEEEEVWALFSKCGAIKDIRIVRDRETGVGKGFAYVNFESNDGVELALSLDGELLKDRNIRVKRAVNRPKNKIPTSDKQPNKFRQKKKPFGEQKEKKFKGKKARDTALSNKFGQQALKFDDKLNKKKFKKKEKGTFGNKRSGTERLPYQGMMGEEKKRKKIKMNKEERRKKIMAKKLGYA